MAAGRTAHASALQIIGDGAGASFGTALVAFVRTDGIRMTGDQDGKPRTALDDGDHAVEQRSIRFIEHRTSAGIVYGIGA